MKISGVLCILLVCLCITVLVTGCTSSKAPTSSGSGSATTVAPAVSTTPACPDKLVWDGDWDSRYLGMAGNHDLSTAWNKIQGPGLRR